MTTIIKKYKEATEQDKKDFYLLMAAMGFCLDKIEDLRETAIFKQSLKKKLNAAYAEMEKMQLMIGDKKNIKEKGLDPVEIWKQQDMSYQLFENWLNVIFKCPQDRIELLDKYIEIGVQMYCS